MEQNALNSSCGFEFDTQTLSAVDKMEQEHTRCKNKALLTPGLSPIIPNSPQKSSSPFARDRVKSIQSCHNEASASCFKLQNTTSVLGESPVLLSKQSREKTSNYCETLQSKTGRKEASYTESSDQRKSNDQDIIHNNSWMENTSQRCLTQEQCELTSWGLPDSILKQYKKIGITTMFEWQAKCLCTGNALSGGINHNIFEEFSQL